MDNKETVIFNEIDVKKLLKWKNWIPGKKYTQYLKIRNKTSNIITISIKL